MGLFLKNRGIKENLILMTLLISLAPSSVLAKRLYMKVSETPTGISLKIASTDVHISRIGNSLAIDVFNQPASVKPPRSTRVAGAKILAEDLRNTPLKAIRISVVPPSEFTYNAKIIGSSLIVDVKFSKPRSSSKGKTKVTVKTSKKKSRVKRPSASKSKSSNLSTIVERGTVSTTMSYQPQPTQKPEQSGQKQSPTKITVIGTDSTGKKIKVEIVGAQAEAIRYAYEIATGQPLPISGTCRVFIPEGKLSPDSLRKLIEDNLINCQPESDTER